jgi:hypothetical protein
LLNLYATLLKLLAISLENSFQGGGLRLFLKLSKLVLAHKINVLNRGLAGSTSKFVEEFDAQQNLLVLLLQTGSSVLRQCIWENPLCQCK